MADLSWHEAVVKALDGEREPLSCADIAQKIVDLGLRTKVGATPKNTVAARISTSLREDGDGSPFERVGPGLYRLRQS